MSLMTYWFEPQAPRRLLTLAAALAAALSLSAGAARGGSAEVTITYAQACNGTDVILTVKGSGLFPDQLQYFKVAEGNLLSLSSPWFYADADGNATVVFVGLGSLPPLTQVQVLLYGEGSSDYRAYAGPFSLIDCSPSAQLNTLVGQVRSLNVSAGIANSLDAKLSHIQDALAAARSNSVTVACNSLNAFINDVAAQVLSQVITADQAKALTDAALSIEKALGCA